MVESLCRLGESPEVLFLRLFSEFCITIQVNIYFTLDVSMSQSTFVQWSSRWLDQSEHWWVFVASGLDVRSQVGILKLVEIVYLLARREITHSGRFLPASSASLYWKACCESEFNVPHNLLYDQQNMSCSPRHCAPVSAFGSSESKRVISTRHSR